MTDIEIARNVKLKKITEIAKKIEYALDNKEKVLGLDKDWEAKNKKMSKELLQEFLEDGDNSEK